MATSRYKSNYLERLAICHIPYQTIVQKFEIQTASTNQIEPSALARALFFDRTRTSGAVCVSLNDFLCILKSMRCWCECFLRDLADGTCSSMFLFVHLSFLEPFFLNFFRQNLGFFVFSAQRRHVSLGCKYDVQEKKRDLISRSRCIWCLKKINGPIQVLCEGIYHLLAPYCY